MSLETFMRRADKTRELLDACAKEMAHSDFGTPLEISVLPIGQPLNDLCFFSSRELYTNSFIPTFSFSNTHRFNQELEIAQTRTEIHLRCLRVVRGEDTRLWKQEWPFYSQCKINGSCVDLTQVKKNGKNSICLSLNITPYLRNQQGADNDVLISVSTASMSKYPSKTYVLFAQPVLAMQDGPITTSVYNQVELHWNYISKRKARERRYRHRYRKNLGNR